MKRNKIILIGGVLGLFFIVVGITYAYFSANIFNNENTSTINYEAGSLAIELDGGNNIVANAILPGDSPWATKTFTVIGDNDSNGYMPYSVSLVVDENTYSDDAISYTLEGTNTSNNGSIIENRENTKVNYTDIIGSGYFTPGKNLKHTYTLKLYFLDTNTDQSADMRSTFKCHIEINGGRASKNKIRVTFDADGGEVATLSKEVVINGAYGNLPTPTKEGYEFLGWNGKNLFDYEEILKNNSDTVSEIIFNGKPTISWNNNSYTASQKFLQGYFKAGKQYIFHGKMASTQDDRLVIALAYTDNSIVTFGNIKISEIDKNGFYNVRFLSNPVKTPNYLRGIWSNGERIYIDISTFQIEEGTEATEYEPYYIDKYTKVVEYEDHTLKAIWKEL